MADPKEYMTLAEVADYVGVKRASLYYYIHALDIKTTKFKLDKRAYITGVDAQRIKDIKDKPWTAGEDTGKIDGPEQPAA